MTRADDERRRALALLAENPDGCSRAIMLARGFPLSHKAIEIVRVKITEAGRRAL
jgi:hypothetical protein